ncbi:hypothetical protein QE152_g40244 [Popillia japonica]|uniref:Uncharacterized protein n=1 Tax=Popillia japonica TaxID=7064 RepID=A0AAW1HRK1_POPJA
MTKNRSGREGGGGGGHKGTMLDGEGKEGEKNDFCKDGGRGGRGRSKKPDDQINVDEEDSHHELREDDAIAYRSGKLEFNPGHG